MGRPPLEKFIEIFYLSRYILLFHTFWRCIQKKFLTCHTDTHTHTRSVNETNVPTTIEFHPGWVDVDGAMGPSLVGLGVWSGLVSGLFSLEELNVCCSSSPSEILSIVSSRVATAGFAFLPTILPTQGFEMDEISSCCCCCFC